MERAVFESLLHALDEARERVDAAIASVPGSAWDEVIHTGDGAWTRRQLLAHMAANDLRQLIRIRVGAGIPLPSDPEDYEAQADVHTWNQARVDERANRSIEDLRLELRINRDRLIALLIGLTNEQRDRKMPFRGEPTPLTDMVPTLIGHLDQHGAELTAAFD